MTLEERFMRHITKTDSCWIWVGALTSGGYGNFGVGMRKTEGAHRVAYQLWKGLVPTGLCVCHSCDVRACVNPEHLFIGTKSDNSCDMAAKGRQIFQKHPELVCGERNSQSKLTASKVGEIRQLLAAGFSKKGLAKRFGVSRSLIQFIAKGRVWVNG